jgi:hypothetical protein
MLSVAARSTAPCSPSNPQSRFDVRAIGARIQARPCLRVSSQRELPVKPPRLRHSWTDYGAWAGGSSAHADAQGSGVAAFNNVVLVGSPAGPEVATLVADATDDAGDFFWGDAKSVGVV